MIIQVIGVLLLISLFIFPQIAQPALFWIAGGCIVIPFITNYFAARAFKKKWKGMRDDFFNNRF
jgi:hypothetical protein